MNKEPKTELRKYPKEYCYNQNKDNLCKNHSNISIHNRSKIRKEEYLLPNINEKEIEPSSYLFAPVYQTLKAENYIENFNYQPSINIIGNKPNKLENKFLSRQNTEISLKPQSSFNGRLVNKYGHISTNIINENYQNKKINSKNVNHQFYSENSLTYNINNFINNNKTTISNNNAYKSTYSNRCHTFKSPENYLVKKKMYDETFTKINCSSKNSIKKVTIIKNKSNERNKKGIVENKNHFEKKINNSKNKINIEAKSPGPEKDNMGNGNNKLSRKKISEEKENIPYDKSSKSININQNKNFNNNFFHKIEINSSNKNKLIDEPQKISNSIIENQSFKSTIVGNSKSKNIVLFKRRNNLKVNSINNSNKSSYLLFEKGIEILKKTIEKRKYKNWISFKYRLLKEKSYSSYKPHRSLRKIKLNHLDKYKGIDSQNQSINTLDIGLNYRKNLLLNDKISEEYSFPLRNSFNTREESKDLLKENLKLQNINSVVIQENRELIKKIEDMKEQNKKLSKSPRTNNLMIENKILNGKLKNIYIKYLTSKKIYYNNNRLKEIFNQYNRKSIIISHNSKNKINSIYRLINIRKRQNKELLRKYFLIFYYNTKFENYKNKEYDILQRNLIIKQILLNLFYKIDKKLYSQLKKYFYKLYYISKVKQVEPNSKTIENENIINNNDYYNNLEKRKRKLKIIIENIMKNNNIILRSILKQWTLRTKIINMKIMLVKEENMKKIINPIEKLIKNKTNKNDLIINNNLKRDNLIKGIEKLSDIFILYKSVNKKKNDTQNEINNEKNENVSNESFNKRENLINKIYGDKFKYNDDWIIEEKEEEQIEENGESTSAKNDTERIPEDTVVNINDFSNNRSNFENENENM